MRTIIFAVSVLIASSTLPAQASGPEFGPSNPFYAPSTLPFHAPPFDKIKDDDYQPAMEAGMAQQLQEIQAIIANPAPPTFDNTLVPLEKSGQLLQRVSETFYGVVGANSNPTLLNVRSIEAPKLAAHQDAIFLDGKLFARVAAVYNQRNSLHLNAEQLRLVEWTYKEFVHAGANLSEAEKTELKKLNEQLAALGDDFDNKLLAATKNGAYVTTDKVSLAGLNDTQMKGAAEAATARKVDGFVIPLQNTTQQPDLALLSNRTTRQTIFENSWTRAEHGDANDTRETIAKMAQLRAEKAKLLGYPNYAAWHIEDQMAKTPEAATNFMDALIAPATGPSRRRGPGHPGAH
jgi:peptidyl-dipeptidase Dcp